MLSLLPVRLRERFDISFDNFMEKGVVMEVMLE